MKIGMLRPEPEFLEMFHWFVGMHAFDDAKKVSKTEFCAKRIKLKRFIAVDNGTSTQKIVDDCTELGGAD